ncbi:hypothetical protein BD626DRAFT_153917 [Schizophyllum amplum]|uniref:C2H2-type domain-containing protein n=1 Tax=Schizophyllum amplum TaxID=97359 RepID=A0A550C3J1_9AGAR|nr:hypothetical protein BD626DRAFT_153917 [Auriculariopsis ampla]
MPATRTKQNDYATESIPTFYGDVCLDCFVTVHTRPEQERHARSHYLDDQPGNVEKKRPFPCPYEGCSWSFAQKNTREIHIAAKHTGEKKHKCPDCFQAFADPSGRAKHRKNHHGWVSPRARKPKYYAPYSMPNVHPKTHVPACTAPEVMTRDMSGSAYDRAASPAPLMSSRVYASRPLPSHPPHRPSHPSRRLLSPRAQATPATATVHTPPSQPSTLPTRSSRPLNRCSTIFGSRRHSTRPSRSTRTR